LKHYPDVRPHWQFESRQVDPIAEGVDAAIDADGGPISIHYASRTQLPAKTRVFVDFVVEAFPQQVWPNGLQPASGSPRSCPPAASILARL